MTAAATASLGYRSTKDRPDYLSPAEWIAKTAKACVRIAADRHDFKCRVDFARCGKACSNKTVEGLFTRDKMSLWPLVTRRSILLLESSLLGKQRNARVH